MSSKTKQRKPLGRRGLLVGLVGLTVALILLVLLSVAVGSKPIPLEHTLQALVGKNAGSTDYLLVWHSRLPRTAIAIVAASALGAAGMVMQAMTRNPLADPGIFGINSGATLAVILGVALFDIQNYIFQVILALFGAFLAGVTIYLLGGARSGIDPVKLVLAGTAFNVIVMALVQIIVVNNDENTYDFFRQWVVGTFAGRQPIVLITTSVAILLALIITFVSSRQLDSQLLGADMAVTLGVNPRTLAVTSSLSVILLAGAATAAVGPIIFLGLVAPHIARVITGPIHKWALPYTLLISADLALLADVLGRIVAPPLEVQVGIMLGLIGGPFFIFLVTRKKLGRL
ncbi:iron ABC transporter permease [Actinomycetaceae bacterium TAE3-ERU4]|nr:iron ABC transporter permease [Actinomycetaceae bacterium TAE3-ERU4]